MVLFPLACRSFWRCEFVRRRETKFVQPVSPKDIRTDEHFEDNVLFYECFHGNSRSGVGGKSSDRLDRTLAKVLQQSGE